jgi:hypothetical protein
MWDFGFKRNGIGILSISVFGLGISDFNKYGSWDLEEMRY